MISLLTPTTTSREIFWPWMYEQVRSFRVHANRADWIVAVDDRDKFEAFLRMQDEPLLREWNIRILECRGMSLGSKRQALLEAIAPGHSVDVFAWLDDDDWHHPDWLVTSQKILEGLPRDFGLVHRGAFYVELETGRGVIPLPQVAYPVPISFVGSVALRWEASFTDVASGEDENWLRSLPQNKLYYSDQRHHGREWWWAALAHPLSTTAGQKRGWRFDLHPELVDRYLRGGIDPLFQQDAWKASQPALRELRDRVRAHLARL